MMNIAQAAAQAVDAGKSGISVFLDAGLIGLILTNSGLLVKAFIDRKAVKKQLDESPKPGDGETCQQHGLDISQLKEFRSNTKDSLGRIEAKVDRLLERN